MQIVLDVSEFQSVGQLDELLRGADDEIVGVYIKGTQGLTYRDSLATAFAQCAQSHNTAFAYYDFMTNDQADEQESYFKAFEARVPAATLITTLDCEGGYDKGAAGVQHWQAANGGKVVVYAQLSNMPLYAGLAVPKWVAQYDEEGTYYRPTEAEIDAYRQQGYALWQWTDSYMGQNQDASALLGDFSVLKR
jgi:GH25 family lysozyme M1 (1,4-beta-N-acetylmuramidase)